MKHLLPFLLATLICISCARRNTNEKPAPIENNGVNIVYDDTGTGDTTLVFVHGWGINRSYWSDQIPVFSKRYRIVSLDLPGFGESGRNRSDWTTRTFAGDLDKVIGELQLKNVILIGHSMSGDIVLQAAIDNPQRVIAFIGVDNFKNIGYMPSAADKKETEKIMEQLKDNYTTSVKGFFNTALFAASTKQELKDRIFGDIFKNDSTIGYATIMDSTFNEAKKVRDAKRTLYLINSDYQPVDTTWMVSNNIRHKIYWIHDTGHYPMNEKPADFNAQLTQALADIAREKKVGN